MERDGTDSQRTRFMITVWFLMALMSYPSMNAIHYKGFGGFLEKEECEDRRIITENEIANMEINRNNTVYIETYCIEMKAFPTQLEMPRVPQKSREWGV